MSTALIYDSALAIAGAFAGEMIATAVVFEGAMKSSNPASAAGWMLPVIMISPLAGAVAALYFVGGKPIGGDMALPIVIGWGVLYVMSPNKK